MARRQTKVDLARLFDDPTHIFKTCEVIVFPDGHPSILVRSKDGVRSFRITPREGPAGLSLSIDRAVNGPAMTASGNLADENWTASGLTDYARLDIVQYKPDAYSQAFRKWCEDTKNTPYPGTREEW